MDASLNHSSEAEGADAESLRAVAGSPGPRKEGPESNASFESAQSVARTPVVEYTEDFDEEESRSEETDTESNDENEDDDPGPATKPKLTNRRQGPRQARSLAVMSKIPVKLSGPMSSQSCGDYDGIISLRQHYPDHTHSGVVLQHEANAVQPFSKKMCTTHTMRRTSGQKLWACGKSGRQQQVKFLNGDSQDQSIQEQEFECGRLHTTETATASLTVQIKRCGGPLHKFSKVKSTACNRLQHQIATRRMLNHHKTPAPVGFVQRCVASAKRIQVKDLTSRIRDLEGLVEGLKYENRSLKTVHFRQNAALKKYEGAESDLTKMVTQHKNEVHYLQSNLRKVHGICRDHEEQIRSMTHKMNQLEEERRQLRDLVKQQNLDKRHALAEQLKGVTQHAEALKARLIEYERHVDVLEKNHFHQIEVEHGKIRALNKKVLDVRKEVEIMAEAGHQKDRIINYLRMRCGRDEESEAPMVKKMYEQMQDEALARQCEEVRIQQQVPSCKLDRDAQSGESGHFNPRQGQSHEHHPRPRQEIKPKISKSYRRQTPRVTSSVQGSAGQNDQSQETYLSSGSGFKSSQQQTSNELDLDLELDTPRSQLDMESSYRYEESEDLKKGEQESGGNPHRLQKREKFKQQQQDPNSGQLSLMSGCSFGSSRKSIFLEALESSCNVSSLDISPRLSGHLNSNLSPSPNGGVQKKSTNMDWNHTQGFQVPDLSFTPFNTKEALHNSAMQGGAGDPSDFIKFKGISADGKSTPRMSIPISERWAPQGATVGSCEQNGQDESHQSLKNLKLGEVKSRQGEGSPEKPKSNKVTDKGNILCDFRVKASTPDVSETAVNPRKHEDGRPVELQAEVKRNSKSVQPPIAESSQKPKAKTLHPHGTAPSRPRNIHQGPSRKDGHDHPRPNPNLPRKNE